MDILHKYRSFVKLKQLLWGPSLSRWAARRPLRPQIRREMEQVKGLTFDIARLSALNTYYSAITAVNSEISATYHLMNG